MIEESLLIPNSFGEKLEVLIRKPDGVGPFPAVLFVSGFGMDLHENINSHDEISTRLVEKGFLTLQFSFAGCGNSEGDYREMTLERQGKQIEDMILYLQKLPDVAKERIGIHATSFGVPSTLSSGLFSIASFSFVSGAIQPERSITQVFREERGVTINYDGDTSLPRSSGKVTWVGKVFWKSIAAFSYAKSLGQLHKPALLIHGARDTKIITQEMTAFFDAIKSDKKKLKIFEGGDHGIADVPRAMREEFLDIVADWFKETL